MKIMWHGTAPWSSSSYSVLTARTVPDIVRSGHQVVLSTWYGLDGNPLPWTIQDPATKQPVDSVTVLPSVDRAGYGAGGIPRTYGFFKTDCLITCSDIWVIPRKKTAGTVFCPWFPVDHDPPPKGVIKSLGPAAYPMCFSQWGVNVLAGAGVRAHYVPCSAPADIFKPEGDRLAARKKFEFPDHLDFIVTMVAANKDPQDRKGFNEAVLAFAAFLEKRPNAGLCVHTYWDGAIKLAEMVKRLGIEKNVFSPDQYQYLYGMIDQRYMARLYHASDVLLNPAKSEGFGLPIVEAQMCGCPVIASDYSTTKELLFSGWRAPVIPDWTLGADSFRARCTIEGIVDALEAAYAERNNPEVREQARAGAIAFDTPRIFETYWKPALADIQGLIEKSSQPIKLTVV